ncbi:MAG: tetratricopeptide repeat protein [Planctomycetota bacterium]|nr:MAG: tetratricopeptide repeat protein [Planctomycetota bacterium]
MGSSRPLLRSAALLAACLLPAAALGDVVHLTTGSSVRGTVVHEDDAEVVVKTPQGKVTFPRELVERIERESKGRTRLALARERMAEGDYEVAERLLRLARRDSDSRVAREAESVLARLRRRREEERAERAEAERPPPSPAGGAAPTGAAPPRPAGRRLRLGGGEFVRGVRASEVVLALRAGDARKALALLREVRERWKRDPSFAYLVARALRMRRRESEARTIFRSLLEGTGVDFSLPLARLEELARRRLAGVELGAHSPGATSEWRREESEHFAIYHPFERVEAWFTRAPEDALRDDLEALGLARSEARFSGRVQILIYSSAEDYERREGMKLAGGHARVRYAPDGPLKLIATYPNRRVYTDTYRHEIAHTVLLENYPDMPAWAHEGAAMWCEPPQAKGRLRAAVQGQEQGGSLPSLLTMLRGEVPRGDDRRAVRAYYGQCTVSFEALAELTGSPREALELCEEIGRSGPERALAGAGLSLERVERAWKKHAHRRE